MESERTIEGYAFEDAELFADAENEKRAVDYLREQIEKSSPEAVLSIYHQLMQQNLFHTQIGFEFLRELQLYLYEQESIDNARISPITIPRAQAPQASSRAESEKKQEHEAPVVREEPPARPPTKEELAQMRRLREQNRSLTNRFRISLFVSGVCGVVVVAMFILTLTSSSPTILNYKTKLEDSYAQWEQQLTDREKIIKEREAQLNEREAALAALEAEIETEAEEQEER